MVPPFLFQVDEIHHIANGRSNYDSTGAWKPSPAGGAHRQLVGLGATGKTWLCNGERITEHNGNGLPHGSSPYRTFSLYYSAGHGFHVLAKDATDSTGWETWKPLQFLYSQNDLSSEITNAGQYSRLNIQRNDQHWPRLLLPDIYHTPRRTQAPQYGGLKGELAILLGLYAFSTSVGQVSGVLPHCFYEGIWRVHQYSRPRDNERGVVVKVYTCPQNISGGSTKEMLSYYEDGNWGNFLH